MTLLQQTPSAPPRPITKVLIANRGEIAVRVIRACKDAAISSVAVYADSDRDALHVNLADEAYALGGERAQDTYLSIDKLIEIARRSGADAVHPGYGFLAENADFARAVIAAGITWVGPTPDAIESLGDKVSARHIAQRAGAPLAPGTADPIGDVSELHDFVAQFGLPVAVKAAFGGGGRGIKVVRATDEIDELYESAVREATAAFGRGECFVERYLDKPRHVETQCLADAYGTVVVVSTRDCSLQRRHQKLVEEAPAPFVTEAQRAELVRASIAILREAKYVGAGTCEFLIGADGTVSFLEVNTRLQVEHPVTEEISGIDLVREQLRIAAGEPLGYDSVETRGHSIEFRINGEDPALGFIPTPGTITDLRFPSGPGVRIDSGVRSGDTISGSFDSMLAKVIVTGADRRQAIARARRALAELEVGGIPTVTPFHRAVLDSPAFAPDGDDPFSIYTSWIESEFMDTLSGLTPTPVEPKDEDTADAGATERVVVEVGGKRLEVVIPAGLGLGGGSSKRQSGPRKPASSRRSPVKTTASSNSLSSPMQGTIVKIEAAEGTRVEEGDLVVVLEAMKMEQPLTAHRSGTISGLIASVGDQVTSGSVICEIVD
ncbi:biotin carboxylase N-terminal domain-containing protein [Rarobacter faecitabidus]|uniref:biotin carboxylase n=1 Tax=Rarobacter faecitabidus TaxID=13243 RepID=A0A542ZV60_RARFA|nr:biotin carboxylase N-terminal domain-containing protein [Rarobacter faecitabidus]TQL64070.1 biotin carboxyl carrier protein /biotin carboxylase [Rarobacter faecitabidus]